MVFMAELFWWFEVVKPSFVQPRVVHSQGNYTKDWFSNVCFEYLGMQIAIGFTNTGTTLVNRICGIQPQ